MWAISALNGLFNEDLCTGLLGSAFFFQVRFLLFKYVYCNMLAQVLYRCVPTSCPGIKSHWLLAEPSPKANEVQNLQSHQGHLLPGPHPQAVQGRILQDLLIQRHLQLHHCNVIQSHLHLFQFNSHLKVHNHFNQQFNLSQSQEVSRRQCQAHQGL